MKTPEEMLKALEAFVEDSRTPAADRVRAAVAALREGGYLGPTTAPGANEIDIAGQRITMEKGYLEPGAQVTPCPGNPPCGRIYRRPNGKCGCETLCPEKPGGGEPV